MVFAIKSKVYLLVLNEHWENGSIHIPVIETYQVRLLYPGFPGDCFQPVQITFRSSAFYLKCIFFVEYCIYLRCIPFMIKRKLSITGQLVEYRILKQLSFAYLSQLIKYAIVAVTYLFASGNAFINSCSQTWYQSDKKSTLEIFNITVHFSPVNT